MAMTLDNTKENIQKLENDRQRLVYWLSSKRYGYQQDTDI